ncbi:SDR family oxidoreductase [Pseudomonas azotoformans]|jgi:NAD(P)-dependent dehydrogenase (short-subunit alcohol dehydrogenase family)|uniref:SDR family oxidoreductase n=2 Tax=Pseudomonas TaxID=286 RepID=A0ABY9FP93_9PSED|nr:SDR family oxidoreductase [Pseudomonas lurida]QDH66546.1 SDR family oxidoreductase [Pseudomonas azotoformans]WLH05119.1 SDR family oxidoreductase [Pseudomonas lurida]
MMRTIVISGGASAIGRAVAVAFRARGCHVITVDGSKADVVADLAVQAGRDNALRKIKELTNGRVDSVIVSAQTATGDPGTILGLNFFAATQLVEGLRSLLVTGPAPRVVLVSCEAILQPHDLAIIDACLAKDEYEARSAAASAPEFAYASSKLALSYWVKQQAVSHQWSGAGIILNAVAPGVEGTKTPPVTDSEESRAAPDRTPPTRIGRSPQPNELAALIVFLASPENSHIIGQTIFCDGGAEAALRPHHV